MNEMFSVPVSASETIRAEAFESSLHPKILGRAGASEGPGWRLIHLEQGTIELADGSESVSLDAPCVIWEPWHKESRARISAGAVGVHVLLGSGVLANVVGHKPESPELRFMADRRIQLLLSQEQGLGFTISRAMAAVVKESRQDAPAARTVIEAVLRIVLINLWRAQGAPRHNEPAGSITRRYIGQFNNLVEVHFRQRWSVADYARALGITPDRLNDICKRARDMTPGEIISTRLGVEAKLMLENSLHSLDQIASQLGFPSAAQFNRFFKSLYGVPPGQYRRQFLARAASGQEEAGHAALFEWP